MLRGVERAPLESRKAIRRATATDEVCTFPAALVGVVATFVLAVTQPASDDANATSANPVEIRRVAVTHSFDIRNPPGRVSANLRIPNHASERSRSWQHASKYGGAERARRNFVECCQWETVRLRFDGKSVAGKDHATTRSFKPDEYVGQ